MTIEKLYPLFLAAEGITADTRNLKPGALFFALKGSNFNGNDFAEQALQEGCVYAVVDEGEFGDNEKIIRVDDVLITLQNLARHHRRQFNIPVIGITGSNGKTTVKELTGAVLQQKYTTLITQGNLNNHLGVPFTLLNMNSSHEMAIIEMGANKPGDIQELVEIAEPTHGIITNVGAAHIEGFGSLEGVVKTKTEMYRYIDSVNGTLFINVEDDKLVENLPVDIPICTYGEFHGDYRGNLVTQDPFIGFNWYTGGYESPTLKTNLVGKYNFINFLSAIAIGQFFDVTPEAINTALQNYQPTNNRSQVTRTGRNTLIVDCYNANATSMKAALESFVAMNADKKCVILGDMLELGDISIAEHQKIVDFLTENKLNAILVGNEMQKVNTHFPTYPNWQAALKNESLNEIKDSLILLKGSRGIKLEELIPHL